MNTEKNFTGISNGSGNSNENNLNNSWLLDNLKKSPTRYPSGSPPPRSKNRYERGGGSRRKSRRKRRKTRRR